MLCSNLGSGGYSGSAEEAKVPIVKVERITERIIVKAAESLLLLPHLHQLPQLCSGPPQQPPHLLPALSPHSLSIKQAANLDQTHHSH
ncbi:hypothetical protein CDL15_Pgr013115 [Punica granatum]|uniref:Uncharacterized protein n=1 Tax=Punica granatum TaxID=22663 RepID=A0A218WIK3_PUNGR|nr:hypothetical protein CDL15_Pgr013115 [Punica granatum]